MKRTLNIFILAVLSVVFFNASTAEIHTLKGKVAVLEFETETLDYGTITQNSDDLRTFNFINTGNAALVISKQAVVARSQATLRSQFYPESQVRS